MSDLGADLRRETLISNADPADFLALLKPRVMSLVVFTALVGLLLAPGAIHPVIGATAILAIAVGGGASGALNMWYEAETDALMRRTANRPIPAGRVTREEALAFGLCLAFFSVMVLGLATNWVAAGLLAFTIFFYAVVYTMLLKRRTAQNIVIGGAAGALPPVIGWAAVTGSLAVEPLVLFAIIFLWTPPHFWALALVKSGDYGRAGIPMLPNVAGERATRMQILLYTLVLVPFALVPLALGFAGPVYAVAGFGGGLLMLVWAFAILRAPTPDRLARACWRMFGGSILYLFALFAALLLEWSAGRLAPLLPGGWA
ncbi:heme o synthase [Rhabdaerophilum calidifontis]|uniref:heme o synthase n=1 Tax=Rhabdaerophilum calidifontis TaxID=2604328 RepID=UPI0012393EBB|nr:heme o synthase [Rhabdaerophilum calidifontis]